MRRRRLKVSANTVLSRLSDRKLSSQFFFSQPFSFSDHPELALLVVVVVVAAAAPSNAFSGHFLYSYFIALALEEKRQSVLSFVLPPFFSVLVLVRVFTLFISTSCTLLTRSNLNRRSLLSFPLHAQHSRSLSLFYYKILTWVLFSSVFFYYRLPPVALRSTPLNFS